jgi:hypothetical protein
MVFAYFESTLSKQFHEVFSFNYQVFHLLNIYFARRIRVYPQKIHVQSFGL